MKKSFTKTICSLLLIILVAIPFLSLAPQKAEAQNSLSGYIQDLTPVITKMPGCKKAIGAGVTDLFAGIKNLFSSKASKAKAKAETLVAAKAENVALQEVGVSDAFVRNKIILANEKLDAQKKAQESMDNNQNCLNAIGKSIVKILINRLTESIVIWIQTGDAGGPMFVQNPGQFFGDIAKNEILGFGNEISDPNLFPFGKAFMQAQANSFKSKFANNAQYSLNEMIRETTPEYSATGFQADFSQGGWNAWDAMTQNPANNPLGFALMASNELAKRIEDKTSLAAGSLQQSGGYLGAEVCAVPKGVTKEEHEAALKEMAASSMEPYQNRLCEKWEIVTPGKLIGDEIGNTIMKKDSALLDAETLNDAMAAILDTVLAKFTSSLQENGLAELNVQNPYEINSVSGIGNFRNQEDYSSSQINASAWLEDHPDFDIRTDLNQALIDEQRIYMEKLALQNKEIMSEVQVDPSDEKTSLGNYGLVPTIYQLDYCMPGPHPGWEEDAQTNLTKIQDSLAAVQFTSGNDAAWWKFIDDLTGNVIGGLVTSIEGLVFKCGDADDEKASKLYLNRIADMTGLWHNLNKLKNDVDPGNINTTAFCEIDGFINATDQIQKEYEDRINEEYALKFLPSVAREAQTKYGEIDNYLQIMKDNIYTIDTLTGVIRRLESIKGEIDTLNCRLDPADTRTECSPKITTTDEYETDLTPWKNAFARISSSLYSGDDIADADNVTKQVIEEKEYIYKNLIIGATGCEEESENGTPYPYSWQLAEYERPAYPQPHLYEYPGRIKDGSSITVPPDEDDPMMYKSFMTEVKFWDWENCGNPADMSDLSGPSPSPLDWCGSYPNSMVGKSGFRITNPLVTKGDVRLAGESCGLNDPPPVPINYCTNLNMQGIIDVTGFVDIGEPGYGGSAYYWQKALGIY